MIVVSDTSPVTSLISIGRIEILRSLFAVVCIPASVHRELKACHAEIPPFIEIRHVKDAARVAKLEASLDRAEAEAIVLAHELKAEMLLIDEKAGRRIAQEEGLRVVGLLGVLVLAKEKGLLDSLSDTIRNLQELAGFYVSEEVRDLVLQRAGERP